MDQKKIGAFLKMLRNQQNITQEQLAERFGVSSRTVSRWETGSNMPDLSILVELADYYQVEIREILDGERKSENMDQETKDTLMKVAAYTDAEKKKLKTKILDMSVAALIMFIFYMLLDLTNGFGVIPAGPCQNIADFTLGLTLGCLILNILYLCGLLDKIRAWKLGLSRSGEK